MKAQPVMSGIILITVILSMSFWSCRQPQQRAMESQLAEVKQSVVKDLIALRSDIEDRLEFVEQELEDATGGSRETLQEARDELQLQIGRLESEIQRVGDATIEEWDEVVAQVSRTATSVRTRTNEVSSHVRQMLDEQ